MSARLSELWPWLLGALTMGAALCGLLVRARWIRRLREQEDGFRRRARAVEEGWLLRLENAAESHRTELEQARARVQAATTDLQAERGRVTTLRDDLAERDRALEAAAEARSLLRDKLAQLDERLAAALERSDRYEVELRATRAELDGLLHDQRDLSTRLSRRGTRLQELEQVLGLREARILDLEPLVDQVRERTDQIDLLRREHDAERLRLESALVALREQRDRQVSILEARVAQLERAAAEDANALELQRLRRRVAELEQRPRATPDDLRAIRGVGPAIERRLHALGVREYRQIAAWTVEDVQRMNATLQEYPGRILREDWVSQARSLHAQKYGEERIA